MRVYFGPAQLALVQGDITEQDADAIVNAANSELAGGGGVDGAIHRAAGPSLLEETRRRYPQGCRTGDAVPTAAGLLRARHVFHAVGPVWRGGQQQEAKLLASAYQRAVSSWPSSMSAGASPFRRSVQASTDIPGTWRRTVR